MPVHPLLRPSTPRPTCRAAQSDLRSIAGLSLTSHLSGARTPLGHKGLTEVYSDSFLLPFTCLLFCVQCIWSNGTRGTDPYTSSPQASPLLLEARVPSRQSRATPATHCLHFSGISLGFSSSSLGGGKGVSSWSGTRIVRELQRTHCPSPTTPRLGLSPAGPNGPASPHHIPRECHQLEG